MKPLIFILILFLNLYLVTDSFPDTINLKNKRSIEGIIEEEDAEALVLNVGFGTIKIHKKDIESIERLHDEERIMQQWRKQYFENYPAPTPREGKLLKKFRELKLEREKTIRKVTSRASFSREIPKLQKEISGLQDNLDEVGKQLMLTSHRDDVVRYNNLVVKFNSLSNDIKLKMDGLFKIRKDHDAINEFVANYTDQLASFINIFEEKHKIIVTKNPTFQQLQFYENLKKKLQYFQKDFKQESVNFKQSGLGILVKVLLNQHVWATMLLDTGAELTIISARVAEKLGIEMSKIQRDVNLVLADGRKLAAKLTTLNTIKIGNSESKNVAVAIVENMPGNNDGFLGMSFLRNFAFSIDVRQQELTLSSFNPQ